jgi:hypothetical protein
MRTGCSRRSSMGFVRSRTSKDICADSSPAGNEFKKFTLLAEEIAHSVRAHDAILDGEIVCLGSDGRSKFYDYCFAASGLTSSLSTC